MRAWVHCGLVVGLMSCLAACGPGTGTSETVAVDKSNPAELLAAGWAGGGPVGLTGDAGALRAVLFLDLESKATDTQARHLATLSRDHPDLIVIGATKSNDSEAAAKFIERTGFPGSVALGVKPSVLAHYRIEQRPALRVVGTHGKVVGRELITLMAHLGRRPSSASAAR